jgi:hypothetical protein
MIHCVENRILARNKICAEARFNSIEFLSVKQLVEKRRKICLCLNFRMNRMVLRINSCVFKV